VRNLVHLALIASKCSVPDGTHRYNIFSTNVLHLRRNETLNLLTLTPHVRGCYKSGNLNSIGGACMQNPFICISLLWIMPAMVYLWSGCVPDRPAASKRKFACRRHLKLHLAARQPPQSPGWRADRRRVTAQLSLAIDPNSALSSLVRMTFINSWKIYFIFID
jgi:hypothetical protein